MAARGEFQSIRGDGDTTVSNYQATTPTRQDSTKPYLPQLTLSPGAETSPPVRTCSPGGSLLEMMRPRRNSWPRTESPGSERIEDRFQNTRKWPELVRTKSFFSSEGSLTATQAMLSVVSALMGAGNLALPFAMAATGWTFAPILVGITVACAYTARLLVDVKEKVEPEVTSTISSYEGLTRQVLGPKGQTLTGVIIFIELYGAGVGYLILLGANLNLLFPAIPTSTFTVAAAASLYPTLLMSLDILANLSVLGVLSSSVLVLTIVIVSIAGDFQFVAETENWRGLNGLGVSCGIALYTFAGHAVVPNIHNQCKDKRGFKRAIDRAFSIVLVLFVLIGAGGYGALGPDVAEQFTLSLPDGICRLVAVVAISVNVFLSFGVLLASPCELLETWTQGLWSYSISPTECHQQRRHRSRRAKQVKETTNENEEDLEFAEVAGTTSAFLMGPPKLRSAEKDHRETVRGGIEDIQTGGWKLGSAASSSSEESNEEARVVACSENEPLTPAPQPFLRLGIVASAAWVATTFPNFAVILSLIGCACDMTICFILPALMHAIVILDAQRLLRGPSFEALVKRKNTRSQYVELVSAAAQYERQNSLRESSVETLGLWALLAIDVALIVLGIAGMVLGISATLSG